MNKKQEVGPPCAECGARATHTLNREYYCHIHPTPTETKYCCPSFKYHAEWTCDHPLHNAGRLACAEVILHKYHSEAWIRPKWGIPNIAGGGFTQIYFCPWCGTKTK